MKTTFNFLIIFTLILLSNIIYSQSVPSYVPTNGLVGWWGFNGNAQDGSGNGNHGTVNGATLTTDRFGNQNGAYYFDGVDDLINLGNISYVNSGVVNEFTMSIWVNLNRYNDVNNGGQAMIIGDEISQNNGTLLQIHSSLGFGTYTAGSSGFYCNCIPNLNVWNNYVIIQNLTGQYLYINGQLWGQLTSQLNSEVNAPIRCGLFDGCSGACQRALQGKLDDIGIWNRALSQQEITNLYNSQLPTQTSLCLPTITTTSPSSVGVDSVVIGGNITNDGGSSIVLRGVCYSTSPNPNMGNSRTEDGSGVGSFNTVLRGLNPSTTYYARSYAKNSNGVVVYGNEVSFTTNVTIGTNYAGGIVFYVDGTGQHGLVCAPSDQMGFFEWGCRYTDIGGTSTAFGTGQANTNLILAGCSQRPIAASVCDDLVLNGYSDWYLPSKDELQLMYSNLSNQGIGGFSYGWYWSSSQVNQYDAWPLDFSNGTVWNDNNKINSKQVRAVRSF